MAKLTGQALVTRLVFDGPRRSHDDIMRIGAAQRAWRARPWWYRLLFDRRRPAERLTVVELIHYQTFERSPLFDELLQRTLYDGPGRTIRACHSPNEIPSGRKIEERFEWRN